MTANAIDIGIVALAGLGAIVGARTGLLRGLANVVCACLTLFIVVLGYQPVGAALRRLTGLGTLATMLIAFVALTLLSHFVCLLFVQRPFAPLLHRLARLPGPRRLDALLGVLPGVAAGFLVAGAVLAPLAFLAPGSAFGPAVRDSRLAQNVLNADATILEALHLRHWLEPAVDTLSSAVPYTESEQPRQLPFTVPASALTEDQAGEQQLLALLNGEREKAGLAPLAWDPALAAVARAHAEEMFAQGYFAHDSPTAGSPFDRMRAAHITFVTAGENLAFAPSVPIAHRGLMESPGHRANILAPAYGRVGIGIIRSPHYGLMIVEDFRD
ncbi:MAG TPA: CvpA family protein [Thermomicrobiales bacterium]|nr:CvpA family protein [Thermomicrobiales bacterium]